jgi:hypothetical protein
MHSEPKMLIGSDQNGMWSGALPFGNSVHGQDDHRRTGRIYTTRCDIRGTR